MAVISFENYVIDESYYKVNDNFDYSQDELNMPVTFSAEVGVDKNHEKAYVIININLGNSEENVSDIPFTFASCV